MRVSAIDLYTSDVEFMTVNLRTPGSRDKYHAKAIIGLDADELNPRFYGFGAVAGAKYHEYTRKVRDIVMRVVLNPNYKLNERYSDIRDDFYRAISMNRTGEVRLVLRSGASSVAQIYGRIIKLEVPHFSKIPELQVTIRCDDPIFRGVSPVELESADIVSGTDLIEFTDAISTAPHGFTLVTTVSTGVSSFTLRAPDDDWVFDVAYALVAGDVLTLSTEYGAKALSIFRSPGTTINLMDKVTTESFWPVIFPGYNEWGWDNLANFGAKTLSYKTAFWGV